MAENGQMIVLVFVIKQRPKRCSAKELPELDYLILHTLWTVHLISFSFPLHFDFRI